MSWELVGVIISFMAIILALLHYAEEKSQKALEEGIKIGQERSEKANFLVPGDRLVMGRDEVSREADGLLESAKKYIKIITVTGAAWLIDKKVLNIIREKSRKGVEIKVILIDPTSPVAEYIEEMEGRYTRMPRPYERPGPSIRENILMTIRTINQYAEIRVYNGCFIWKGTIIDGEKVTYTIFDVPRNDTPLRINKDPKIAKHFEIYYFDRIWEQSRPVEEALEELKSRSTRRINTPELATVN